MYQVYGLLLFIATPWLAQAQYEKFLKDPDIIWAAEIEITYSLKPPPAADPLWENDISYWKNFDPKAAVQYEGGEMLIRKMLEAAHLGAWPVWQLHNMGKQILPANVLDSLYYRDTIVTFDVVTFEEIIKVVQNEFDPAYFTAIRAKQLLYFNHKKGEFGLATYSVAPVFTYIRNNRWQAERDTILEEFTPFWLKMPACSKKSLRKHPNVNDSKIVWAAQVKTRGNSPEPDNLPSLKNTNSSVMATLLHRFRNDPRYKATDFFDEPLVFASRNRLFSSPDTIIWYDTTVTFEQETYNKNIEITPGLQVVDIRSLRLVENWFWDERQQRLIIRLERFAPIVDGDRLGVSFPFSRPLFYRRVK